MILAELILDNMDQLRFCRIEGHSGAGTRGNDIVCAAVSVLARTIVNILSDREDISVRVDAPERGNFLMEVDYKPAGRDFLTGAGCFLIEGLLSVQAEYPGHCKVSIERRNSYGT